MQESKQSVKETASDLFQAWQRGIEENGWSPGLTVSGGDAVGFGGGISNNGGTLTVTNSTVSGNSSFLGGGGIITSGNIRVRNTIIAGNTANAFTNCSVSGSGSLTDEGNNLSNDNTCPFTSADSSQSFL